MSYGFRIKNNDDTILVDDTYFNYTFDNKISGFPSTPTLNGGGYVSDIVVNSPEPPIIAVKSQAGVGIVRYENYSTTYWRYYRRATNNLNIETFVFMRPKGNQTGYGLRVRDSTGKITFDSREKAIPIIDVITGTDGNSASFLSRTWTYPSNKKVAVVQGQWCGQRYLRRSSMGSSFIDTAMITCCLRNVNDYTLQGARVNTWNYTAGSQNTTRYDLSQPNYMFIVLDVTNI